MNDSNEGGTPAAENQEGSNRAKENAVEVRTVRARQRGAVSAGPGRVRQAARRKAGKFTSLPHHVTLRFPPVSA